MDKRTRQTWFHRLFCLLMAFYVINISIDAPDGYVRPDVHGQYREDLSINEIESFSELVLEHWLGITDAVPEHDEPDEDEDTIVKCFFDWSLPAPAIRYHFDAFVHQLPQAFIRLAPSIYFSTPAEILAPPPQVAASRC